MLKMLEDKMEHENDKWLEDQLKTEPPIAEDDFVTRVMQDVEESHSKAGARRKIILFSTYLISFLVFALVTPWQWFSSQISMGRAELVSNLSVGADMQIPFVTLSLIFIAVFFGVVLGLEQK